MTAKHAKELTEQAKRQADFVDGFKSQGRENWVKRLMEELVQNFSLMHSGEEGLFFLAQQTLLALTGQFIELYRDPEFSGVAVWATLDMLAERDYISIDVWALQSMRPQRS